ncbi:MAG: DUF4837 family protein [Bacteroidota bacterium]
MLRLGALFSTLLVLTGCVDAVSGPPKARGNVEEVLVLSDSVTWAGPAGEAIRAELGRPIRTLPSSQGAFKVRYMPLTTRALDNLRLTPNLVFAAPIDAESPIGEFLRARVGEENLEAVRSGRADAVNVRPDLWARDQVVVIATAGSDSALATAFRDRGEAIRTQLNDLARVNTEQEMFARMEQTDLGEAMLGRLGARVRVQHDYVQVQDTTAAASGQTGDFVRYRRVLSDSWRDFFVFAVDGVEAMPTEAEVDAMTNDLLRQFAVGVTDTAYVQLDDQRPMTTAAVEIAGRPAAEKRGLWYMVHDLMGGAYIRYAVRDEDADRLYLYYGMTFAPDRALDKRKLLRQMEVIAYTLRTEADLAAEAAAST